MAAKTLITAATGAATSDRFNIMIVGGETQTIVGYGMSAGDTIDLQISHDDGTTFNDHYENGDQTQLTSTNTTLTFATPGIFRLNKGATTGTAGAVLYLNREVN